MIAAMAGAVVLAATAVLPSVALPTALSRAAAAPQSDAAATATSELDALMRQVLDRRDANTRRLMALAFRETEELVIRGQEGVAPLQSYSKEFAWSGRDGRLVRDPLAVNGVRVRQPGRAWDPDAGPAEARLSGENLYSWDSLFRFPYEPGRYFFAGRESFEGREVLRIEYYPRRWFGRDTDESSLAEDFDETALVTILVLPDEQRIVAWEYESIGLQFLPFRWLVRVGGVRAAMIIDVADDGTWLPRRLTLQARASTAPSQITISVRRSFEGYTRDGEPLLVRGPAGDASPSGPGGIGAAADGPAFTPQPGDAVVRGVAFHGNYSLPDGQLAGVAGVAPGSSYDARVPGEMRRRLLDSGLVDRAEIRVRAADLAAGEEVDLIAVVRPRVGLGDHVQFLPLFQWSDEYGITVGGRVSLVDLHSVDDRLSFPLSLGGSDRAAVEYVDDFGGRFLSGVRADAGYRREVNPHFDEEETRVSAHVRVFKRVGKLQFDVDAAWAEVDFIDVRQQQVSFGFSGRFDTRRQTGLPRDAVYLAAGWKPLQIIDGDYTNRFNVDARGYLGVRSRSTLVLGATYDGADGALPAYEKFFLGGLTTLRGFTPGAFIGDNRLAASLEARAQVWEPLPIVIVGVNGFWDTGAVWDHGTDPGKAQFHNGIGFGAFLMAAIVQLNVDVGYGIGDGWQFHIGSGLRY